MTKSESGTLPQVGQIVCVIDGVKCYFWPSDITTAQKADAVGVIFAVDGNKVYVVGNTNTTTKQWSCVADYEITAIPSASGTLTVTLNNVAQTDADPDAPVTFDYVRDTGTIAEFTTQLETFLRAYSTKYPSSKAGKWEAYTNADNGKSYLQMFNYNEYESTVAITGCTLAKKIGTELAEYTETFLHNNAGQQHNYWTGMCRQRLEEYCTDNGSNPSTALDGITTLHPTNSAPCRKSYYDGELGVHLREHYATYGAYLDACMTKLDKTDTGIIHHWNGQAQTFLLSLKDVYVQSVKKPAYPAADLAIKYNAGKTGFTAGSWWLPSMYELGLLMKDIKGNKTDLVNVALTALGWSTISTTSYRWSCCRYNSSNAWYYSSIGYSYYYLSFYLSFAVSVVSAFTID